jgi:radical SAM protein with 4Fe4S-binding SPASM domain
MKLSAPLRVTWDWNWPAVVRPGMPLVPLNRGRAELISAELRRAGILMVEIGYPAAGDIRDGLVARALEKTGANGSVVVSPDVIIELGEKELRQALGPTEVWADITPEKGRGAERKSLPPGEAGSTWPCQRIYLTANNLDDAALLLAAALEEGVRKLSLPILPLFGSFLTSAGKQIPQWSDLVEFANRLEGALRAHPDLDLRVHHQSLWTILRERGHEVTEEEAPGHGGCQAASALAYIDPGGALYPCASLPIPVGRVEEGAIAGAWRDEETARLREAIGVVPSVCGKCGVWNSCRGGCRGWAYYLSGSWEEPGPDCGREIVGQGS